MSNSLFHASFGAASSVGHVGPNVGPPGSHHYLHWRCSCFRTSLDNMRLPALLCSWLVTPCCEASYWRHFPGDGIVPSRRFEKPRLRTSGQPEGGRSLQELSRRHLAVHGLTYLLQWFFRSVASRRNLVDLVSQLEARRNDHDITIFVFAFNVYIVLLSVMKFSDNFSLPGTRHVCLQVCNTRFQRIL